MTIRKLSDRRRAVNASAHLQAFDVTPAERPCSFSSVGEARPRDIQALFDQADAAVRKALAVDFPVDPLFGQELSRLIGIGSSLQRRDGGLLEAALQLGIERSERLNLVSRKPRYALSQATTDYARSNSPAQCQATDLLQATTESDPQKEMDLTFVDLRTSSAVSIDAKRGGKLGDAQNKTLTAAIQGVSLCLRHELASDIRVARGEAYALVFNTEAALRVPRELRLTPTLFDARFGTDVADIVATVREHYASRISEALGPVALAAVRAIAPAALAV